MSSSFELFKKQLDDSVKLIEQSSAGELGELNLPSNLDDIVDTSSLLARCDSICDKYESKKPTIRIIHHLACSGGAELTELLSVMPNVYLLNEVHPFIKVESSSASLEVTDSTKMSMFASSEQLNANLFLDSIKSLYEHLSKQGVDLIIRDNAYFDYFYGAEVTNKSIVSILEQHFNVVSIILYRNTIDAYASLSNANFFSKGTLSFDDYCKRASMFLNDYQDSALIPYEHLSFSTERTIIQVCDQFDINFNDSFELMLDELQLPQYDKWKQTRLDCYNTKLETKPSLEEVGKADSYFDLQQRLKPKDKKLILIATMPRSGSTWLFNCIREIHKCQNLDFYSCWVEDYDPSNPSKIHIVKVHNPEWALSSHADAIITTRRDVRNVCVSLVRMGWLKNDEVAIVRQAKNIANKLHPFWGGLCDLEIEYSDILESGREVIQEIATSLGLQLSKKCFSDIHQKLSRLKNPGNKHDITTQLHPGHRSDEKTDFRLSLDDQIKATLNKECESWLKQFGYL